jgi:hypothetical protein
MKEKSSQTLTEFIRMFRPTTEAIASAGAAALSGSVLSTTCAMCAQLSRLRADCDVPRSKLSSKRMVAALKSYDVWGG